MTTTGWIELKDKAVNDLIEIHPPLDSSITIETLDGQNYSVKTIKERDGFGKSFIFFVHTTNKENLYFTYKDVVRWKYNS